MTPVTSLFLDLVRFLAALVVFLSHLTSNDINSAFPWVPWGHEAVVVFFVISGYVIGHVSATREHLPVEYAAARLGRLYSVVIPALILTVVLDKVGMAFSPEMYSEPNHQNSLLRLIVNAVFAQQVWNLTVEPLSNGPFWSLSFEFWYYCFFGASFFLRGQKRIFVTAALLLCAGPRISAFYSLWLLGLCSHRMSGRLHPALAVKWIGAMVAGAGILAILTFGNPLEPLGSALEAAFPDSFVNISGVRLFLGDIPKLPEDLLLGGCFSVMLFFVQGNMVQDGWQSKIARVIHYLAGATFTLYLFHVPLLYCLLAVFHIPKTSGVAIATIGCVVLGTSIALSHLFERRVASYRSACLDILRRMAALRQKALHGEA